MRGSDFKLANTESKKKHREAEIPDSIFSAAMKECVSSRSLLQDGVLREGKFLRDIQNLTETNSQLGSKVRSPSAPFYYLLFARVSVTRRCSVCQVDEMERRCKSQQQQIFELKQELTNSTAELKLRLAQAEGSRRSGSRICCEKGLLSCRGLLCASQSVWKQRNEGPSKPWTTWTVCGRKRC